MEPMKPMAPMEPMKPMEPLKFDPPWWPEDLGEAASSGAQNGMRYAFFPQKRRLLIERDGAKIALRQWRSPDFRSFPAVRVILFTRLHEPIWAGRAGHVAPRLRPPTTSRRVGSGSLAAPSVAPGLSDRSKTQPRKPPSTGEPPQAPTPALRDPCVRIARGRGKRGPRRRSVPAWRDRSACPPSPSADRAQPAHPSIPGETAWGS